MHRRWHHDQMTFGLLYAFAENFVLPLSHDEVVHGKGSLLARMPGDAWQQFATLRAYYALHVGAPGQEAAVHGPGIRAGPRVGLRRRASTGRCSTIGWHRGVQALVRDCNRELSRDSARCTSAIARAEGFRWIEVDDAGSSVFAWLRFGGDGAPPVAVVANFTPVPREGYRIGLPLPGAGARSSTPTPRVYGGSDRGNAGGVDARAAGTPRLPVLGDDHAAAARDALARARRRRVTAPRRTCRRTISTRMRWTR